MSGWLYEVNIFQPKIDHCGFIYEYHGYMIDIISDMGW